MSISVICSNYNSEKWIDSYLNSLNDQFLENFEVVFVDANSTDSSIDKILNFEFREGISTLILPLKERVGVYEAWNRAIKVARGDYIVNYNTDDHLFKSSLQTYSSYLSNLPGIDLFYSPCLIASPDGKIIGLRNWPQYSHETLKKICICGPFPCVKKMALVDAGLFDTQYKSSADYDMWLKLSSMKKRFKRIDEVLGHFCYREDSVSNTLLAQHQVDDKEIQGKY